MGLSKTVLDFEGPVTIFDIGGRCIETKIIYKLPFLIYNSHNYERKEVKL